MDNRSSGKLELKTKIGYGAAEFSNTLTWTMISVIFLFFLTDVVGMEPSFAGLIMMFGTIWDALIDPSVGILSDRIRSRWGRRRPFILAVAVPYGVITWLLFTDFGLGQSASKIYFMAAIVLYFTCSTLLDVPYTSLAAEMTRDYDERTSLFGFRALFSQIGSIVGAALPWLIIGALAELCGSLKAGWSAMTAGFGLMAIFPILWTWRATRGHEKYSEQTNINLKDILDGPLKNRTFLFTIGLYAASNVALAAAGAVMLYFMKYYMKFNETQESAAFLLLFACTIFWIPLINKLSGRFGKRGAFMILISMWAVVQAVGGLLIQPSMTVTFFIMVILASGGVITVTMLGWSMIPDAVEVDEFKTGRRREGMYIGIILFSRKVSAALVLWLIGVVLSGIGYTPDKEQTETAIWGIRLLYAEGTALFLIISIIMAAIMPMTRARHAALKKAIQHKNNGLAWDEKSIEAIL